MGTSMDFRFRRDIQRSVRRLEEQVSILRQLLITSKTNELTANKRALDKADRRRQVERELLDEEAVHAQGERRLLESEQILLDTLVNGSIWSGPDDVSTSLLDDSNAVEVETDPDVTMDALRVGPIRVPESSNSKPYFDLDVTSAPPAVAEKEPIPHKSEQSPESRSGGIRPGKADESHSYSISMMTKDNKPSTSDSKSTNWIRPKSSKPQKPASNFFPVIPGPGSSDTSRKKGYPTWALEVTRTTSSQREAQKKLKQSTLFDVSKNFSSTKPKTVDLSKMEGFGGGERKIRFGKAPALPPVQPIIPPPSLRPFDTGVKRKSEELEEDVDQFGSESDNELFAIMDLGEDVTTEPVQMKHIAVDKENQDDSKSQTNWQDDSVFDNSALNELVGNNSEELEFNSDEHFPPSPLQEVTPQKQKGVLSLRSKKKEEELKRRGEKFRSTQEIIRGFDKIPGSSPEKHNFKYKPEAVRKQAERRKLPGWDCPECKDYYEAIASQLGVELLQKLKNKCSRHRGQHQEPEYLRNTAPLFWECEIPSTEEFPHRDGVRSPRH